MREYLSPFRPVYHGIEVLKLIIGKAQAGEHCVMKTNYPNKCILHAALFLAYLGFEAPWIKSVIIQNEIDVIASKF